MWELNQLGGMANETKWPEYDEAKCRQQEVEIAVQVNGKIRSRISVAADISDADALVLAKAEEKVAAEIAGKAVVKELYIKGKLVNIVVR